MDRKIAYPTDEAAELLSTNDKQIREWVHAGVLHRVPFTGHRWLIAHLELERFATSTEEDYA